MSERMAGKVAVVTGAASRIGSVYAERLASEGATVVILDRIEASDTVTKLVGLGLKASSTVVDLTDPDQIGRAADQVAHESGGADILINNAGIKRVQTPDDLAGTVAFLVSDDVAFLIGQTIWVDGGLVRSA